MRHTHSHNPPPPNLNADEHPALAPPGRTSGHRRLGSGLRPPSRPPRTLGLIGALAGVVVLVGVLLVVGGVVSVPGWYSPPVEYSDVVRSHPWVASGLVFGAALSVFVLFVSAVVSLPEPRGRGRREGGGSA